MEADFGLCLLSSWILVPLDRGAGGRPPPFQIVQTKTAALCLLFLKRNTALKDQQMPAIKESWPQCLKYKKSCIPNLLESLLPALLFVTSVQHAPKEGAALIPHASIVSRSRNFKREAGNLTIWACGGE